jgi:isopenicillin N synthase-like dioxygenase
MEYAKLLDLSDHKNWNNEQIEMFQNAFGTQLTKNGFVLLKIDTSINSLIRKYFELLPQIFTAPIEEKANYLSGNNFIQRGYLPPNSELKPRQFGESYSIFDHKELWQIGRYHNLLPVTNNFDKLSEKVYEQLERIGLLLVEFLGRFLKTEKQLHELFYNQQNKPNGCHLMRVIHYYPIHGTELNKPVIRGGEHKDLNFLTLLPKATKPGLQIQDATGNWIDIDHLDFDLLVNTGDMLELITSGSENPIKALVHRVVGQNENESRYSTPFFLTPHFSKEIRCTSLVPQEASASYKVGDLVYGRVSKSHVSDKKLSYDEWVDANS